VITLQRPLFNIDAEKVLLSAIMQDNYNMGYISSKMKIDDLYDQEHQRLYRTMLNLWNENRVFDFIILKEYGFDLEYLVNIANVFEYNYYSYLDIVLDLSLRRKMMKAIKEIHRITIEDDLHKDLSMFKANCMEKLDIKIHEDQTTDGKISGSEIENVFKMFDDRCAINGSDVNRKDKYGFSWLDTATAGTHKGEITIVAARPGIGKTAFGLNIALHKILAGANVRMFSLEMAREALLERMIINIADVCGLRVRAGKISEAEYKKLKKAANLLAEKNLFINDRVHTLEEIRAVCRRAKNKDILDYVIIDYFQLLETTYKTFNNNEKLEYMSRRIKLMAMELEVPILLLSQLSRAPEARSEKTPQLSDLRGSGAIEQDADNVLFLHHLPVDNFCEVDENIIDVVLTIAKQRSGVSGKNNVMRFISNHQRFSEIEYKHK